MGLFEDQDQVWSNIQVFLYPVCPAQMKSHAKQVFWTHAYSTTQTMAKVDMLTLVWPSHWPTCHPSSDGSWPPPLLLLSAWSGASPRRLTPRQRSRVQCVLHLGPSLYGKTKSCKLDVCNLDTGRWAEAFLVFCLFEVLACSVNDIIDDLSRHRLWADGPDSPALVEQSVKFLGSLQHGLLRVASHRVWHVWEIFLVSDVRIIIIVVISMGNKTTKTFPL